MKRVAISLLMGIILFSSTLPVQARKSYYGPGSTGAYTAQPVQPVQVQPLTTPASHNGQYGQTTYFGNAYTPTPKSGQYGGVTYFGRPPVSTPSHNGQYGGVTYLNGARPYSLPNKGSYSYGNSTVIAPRR